MFAYSSFWHLPNTLYNDWTANTANTNPKSLSNTNERQLHQKSIDQDFPYCFVWYYATLSPHWPTFPHQEPKIVARFSGIPPPRLFATAFSCAKRPQRKINSLWRTLFPRKLWSGRDPRGPSTGPNSWSPTFAPAVQLLDHMNTFQTFPRIRWSLWSRGSRVRWGPRRGRIRVTCCSVRRRFRHIWRFWWYICQFLCVDWQLVCEDFALAMQHVCKIHTKYIRK